MRWLDSITDTMDMGLGGPRELVMARVNIDILGISELKGTVIDHWNYNKRQLTNH